MRHRLLPESDPLQGETEPPDAEVELLSGRCGNTALHPFHLEGRGRDLRDIPGILVEGIDLSGRGFESYTAFKE
jgi:hypothetical protein